MITAAISRGSAPRDATSPFRALLPTKLEALRNDPSVHEDVWTTPQEGEIPRWMDDEDVRDGIRSLLVLDRCEEEMQRARYRAYEPREMAQPRAPSCWARYASEYRQHDATSTSPPAAAPPRPTPLMAAASTKSIRRGFCAYPWLYQPQCHLERSQRRLCPDPPCPTGRQPVPAITPSSTTSVSTPSTSTTSISVSVPSASVSTPSTPSASASEAPGARRSI
ncbi:hypothetical protein B0H14DRAFT_3466336 [Mycena olivaceomarginata]|nr:hypothetical protein B0H14DRAFT_3466336 [Mycena olivaceomarginata]